MSHQIPQLLIKFCGRGISYKDGLRIQRYYLDFHLNPSDDVNSSPKNVLLLLEHGPVYTTGIRTKDYSIDEETRLRNLGADFYRSDRGGLITFHGPGQLVAYPILNLDDFKRSGGVGGGPRGMKWYVCQLERCLIRLCAEFGLTAQAPGPPLTGVWVERRKIAAIGIHATKRCIVSHGLALNCDVDLSWFDHIVPCGLQGKEVTSLKRELTKLGRPAVGVDEVINPFVKIFVDEFRCEPVYEAENISRRTLPVT